MQGGSCLPSCQEPGSPGPSSQWERATSLGRRGQESHFHPHFTDIQTEAQRKVSGTHNWGPLSHCFPRPGSQTGNMLWLEHPAQPVSSTDSGVKSMATRPAGRRPPQMRTVTPGSGPPEPSPRLPGTPSPREGGASETPTSSDPRREQIQAFQTI